MDEPFVYVGRIILAVIVVVCLVGVVSALTDTTVPQMLNEVVNSMKQIALDSIPTMGE